MDEVLHYILSFLRRTVDREIRLHFDKRQHEKLRVQKMWARIDGVGMP